jgi:hypothetical protein
VTLLWICTCDRSDNEGDDKCVTHGLLRRTLPHWPEPPPVQPRKPS